MLALTSQIRYTDFRLSIAVESQLISFQDFPRKLLISAILVVQAPASEPSL
jgi:hypothetical protein